MIEKLQQEQGELNYLNLPSIKAYEEKSYLEALINIQQQIDELNEKIKILESK